MKINVTRSSMPSFEEYCEEIKDIWESRHLTNSGPKVKELEKELSSFFGVKNVTLFTNGHLALEAALSVYNFPKGSEVITSPFTFVSTVNAIARNGLVPLFCDVDPENYTIDVSKIEKLISDKTVAIVPIHAYGNICNIEAIEQIAKKHHLKIIYDAAHVFGAKYKGKSLACFGDISMFSFHATKVFHTIEGGCLCYNDENLKSIFEDGRNFGLHGTDRCLYIGANTKMSEFQAAMGLCNLRHVSDYINKREKVVKKYLERLDGVEGIKMCKPGKDVISNYAYLPVVFDGYKYSRDEVFDKLCSNDIGTRKYFYPLINDFECYQSFKHGDTPVAKHISDRVLTLPLYSDLSEKDVDLICDIILK